MAVVPLLREVEVVGNHFREDMEKAAFADINVDDRLAVELEPTNNFDAYAVKVLCGGAHVGYIPRTCSAVCHMLSEDSLKKVLCQVVKVDGGVTNASKATKGGGAATRRRVYVSLGVEV